MCTVSRIVVQAVVVLMALFPDIGNAKGARMEFELSEAKLSFEVPANPSKEAPQISPVLRFDLAALGPPPAQDFEELFVGLWSFNGLPWEGARGLLGVSLKVIFRPNSPDLRKAENLWALQQALQTDWAAKHNPSRSAANQVQALANYQQCQLGGSTWIRYTDRDRHYAATGVSRSITLVFSFSFADNTRGKKVEKWRPEAERMMEAILSSIVTSGIPIGGNGSK